MATVAAGGERFDMGRVVQRAFGAAGHNLAVFAGLSALLAGIPAGVFTWLIYGFFRTLGIPMDGTRPTAFPHLDPSAFAGTIGGGVFGWLFIVLANVTLQAAIIYGAIAYLNGRRATFGECLGGALRRLPLLALLGVVSMVGVWFGLLLFIVPGVMMIMAWIVAVPALVTERTGVFGALGRSADLTRGRRWAIFGLVVAYWIAYAVVQNTLQAIMSTFTAGGGPFGLITGSSVVSVVLGIAGQLIGSTGIASIYYELRLTKEGIGPEALAAVFD